MPTQIKDDRHARMRLLGGYLQAIVYGGVILYLGRSIFVPISFSVLISFILFPVCKWWEKKGTGRAMAIVLSLLLLILPGVAVVGLLTTQIFAFADEWPSVESKLMQLFDYVSEWLTHSFSISKAHQQEIAGNFFNQAGGNFLQMLHGAVTASASSMVMLILIPVYVVLILYYRAYWVKILLRMFRAERKENVMEVLTLTIRTYYNFIKGMAIVYLVVGILNSAGLLLLGVPHAILFGFMASVLTFIPYVGIIVGSLLPITMAWITYGSLWYPLGVIAVFTFVQYLEANIIFPFAVSSKLNVNTLTVLVAIFTGGIFWGVAGMILFVPFAGIAKLIADHNPRWKTWSMMLGKSEDG